MNFKKKPILLVLLVLTLFNLNSSVVSAVSMIKANSPIELFKFWILGIRYFLQGNTDNAINYAVSGIPLIAIFLLLYLLGKLVVRTALFKMEDKAVFEHRFGIALALLGVFNQNVFNLTYGLLSSNLWLPLLFVVLAVLGINMLSGIGGGSSSSGSSGSRGSGISWNPFKWIKDGAKGTWDFLKFPYDVGKGAINTVKKIDDKLWKNKYLGGYRSPEELAESKIKSRARDEQKLYEKQLKEAKKQGKETKKEGIKTELEKAEKLPFFKRHGLFKKEKTKVLDELNQLKKELNNNITDEKNKIKTMEDSLRVDGRDKFLLNDLLVLVKYNEEVLNKLKSANLEKYPMESVKTNIDAFKSKFRNLVERHKEVMQDRRVSTTELSLPPLNLNYLTSILQQLRDFLNGFDGSQEDGLRLQQIGDQYAKQYRDLINMESELNATFHQHEQTTIIVLTQIFDKTLKLLERLSIIEGKLSSDLNAEPFKPVVFVDNYIHYLDVLTEDIDGLLKIESSFNQLVGEQMNLINTARSYNDKISLMVSQLYSTIESFREV
ncbi:MAG: hypothetical protein AB7V77_01720 [Candidatus Woesearchaeota archaeon]